MGSESLVRSIEHHELQWIGRLELLRRNFVPAPVVSKPRHESTVILHGRVTLDLQRPPTLLRYAHSSVAASVQQFAKSGKRVRARKHASHAHNSDFLAPDPARCG